MSIQSQRVIWSDNGTLNDLSLDLNDFRASTVTIPFVAAEDYIFIGSELPFNHRYIDVATANDQAATPSVDIWFSNEWIAAVDLLDRTESSGNTLAQSGVLQWSTNRLKGWDIEQDSSDVTGLSGTAVYNMYWVRIGFSADLAGTLALNYIGHKFSSDSDLYDLYPDLNDTDLMGSFETSKTDWNEQTFVAAETIIRDLIRQQIIRSPSQLIDWERLKDASIHKVAELVYGGLGRSYREDKLESRKMYGESLKLKHFNVDANADARLNPAERAITSGRTYR